MKDSHIKQVLTNYLLDICTPTEQEMIEEWLDKEPGNVHLLELVAMEIGNRDQLVKMEKDNMMKALRLHISQESASVKLESVDFDRDPGGGNRKVGNKPNLSSGGSQGIKMHGAFIYWLKIAAVLVLTFSVGLSSWYFRGQNAETTTESTVWMERILSNGQKATFRFPDGSVVHLNGGSLLRYPERFENGVREVYLEGEAFFSIARDDERPFVIRTMDFTTRVLGTSFNIRSYRGEDEVQVAVVEGKVAVTRSRYSGQELNGTGSSRDTFILEKDQWIGWHGAGGTIEQGSGNIREMIAWKDNVLIFNNKTLEEIARMLERWYGVMVRIETEGIKGLVLQGEHNNTSLEEILKSVNYATGIEFMIKDDVVILK